MSGASGGEPQPIIEQTSSSEHHYELDAIRLLLEQSFAVSETMRQEAQRIMALHEQSAGEYLRQLDDDADPHPFQSVPAGTIIRELPDGGRLFCFSDGAFLRVLPNGEMVSVGEDGAATPMALSRAGKVTLPGGRELGLVSDAVTVTHESCGIEGLPHDVEPALASEDRYRVTLPGDIQLDLLRRDRLAVIVNPTGTINVIGIGRIEGIGEVVQARSISGGSKSFRAMESGHAGMIEADGTIHLSLASGLDLAIRFPEDPDDGSGVDTGSICFECEGRDE